MRLRYDRGMTQEERWIQKYNEVMNILEKNHRNPSKYYPEKKLMFHIHHNKKLYNSGS